MLPIRDLCATAFCVLLSGFLRKNNNNAALHFMPRMKTVFALDVATALGTLIARWRHCRWCHHCGNGPCLYSTRGPTGSLLVIKLKLHEAIYEGFFSRGVHLLMKTLTSCLIIFSTLFFIFSFSASSNSATLDTASTRTRAPNTWNVRKIK